jgi:hypothetical protein
LSRTRTKTTAGERSAYLVSVYSALFDRLRSRNRRRLEAVETAGEREALSERLHLIAMRRARHWHEKHYWRHTE